MFNPNEINQGPVHEVWGDPRQSPKRPPTLTDYYDTFAHRYASETGEQIAANEEAMFYAGARAALDAMRQTGVDTLIAECATKAPR